MGTNKVKKFAVRKIIFSTGLSRAAKAEKNYIVWARRANKRTKEGPLVLQEFPFASVSLVSRGHPSLVSLAHTVLKGRGTAQRSFGRKEQQIMILQ
jgi:hypothetical protein